MVRKTLKLDGSNRRRLEMIVKRGENWRQRERARTLLLLDEGVFSQDVAETLGIHVRTVRSTHSQWLESGLASLADRPRSGAPRKLTREHVERLVAWATAKPLTAPALLGHHKEQGGPHVHLNTLVGTLKAFGLVWKRTRHSLKKVEMRLPSAKQP